MVCEGQHWRRGSSWINRTSKFLCALSVLCGKKSLGLFFVPIGNVVGVCIAVLELAVGAVGDQAVVALHRRLVAVVAVMDVADRMAPGIGEHRFAAIAGGGGKIR